MNFSDAILAMKQGEKVRLPWWTGYWYIGGGTLRIHVSDKEDFDFRETKDPMQTLGYMTADCWILVPHTSTMLEDLAQEMNELCKK